MKVIATLFLVVVVIVAGITNATSKQVGDTSSETTSAGVMDSFNHPSLNHLVSHKDPEGTIDGSKNPEKIPDHVAYSLLFRFLSGRHTDAEKKRARSYLKMVFGPAECFTLTGPPSPRMTAAQIDALITAAEEYAQRVNTFDRQSKQTRDADRERRRPETLAKLKQLQHQKSALIAEIVTTLPGRLGVDGADKLRQHINENFKRKVKIKGKPERSSGAGNNSPTVATRINGHANNPVSPSTSREEE